MNFELLNDFLVSSTRTAIGSIIKKDRFKLAAVVWLSTSLSKYFQDGLYMIKKVRCVYGIRLV